MFAFGRQNAARVDLEGDKDASAKAIEAKLGM